MKDLMPSGFERPYNNFALNQFVNIQKLLSRIKGLAWGEMRESQRCIGGGAAATPRENWKKAEM
ncbi:hypothetical protein JCM17960_19400 [Magnetospira thiophila]